VDQSEMIRIKCFSPTKENVLDTYQVIDVNGHGEEKYSYTSE